MGAMGQIRIAVVGVGNCASSLLQGVAYYGEKSSGGALGGLMADVVGGYRVGDILPVVGFDVDARKVGRGISEAVFALPNCTKVFCDRLPESWGGVPVVRGPVMDGVAGHVQEWPEGERVVVGAGEELDLPGVVRVLRERGAEVLVNYLPVGSQRATEFYAEACLHAGVALVNCIPVLIASDAGWAGRFAAAGLPVVGDDIKAQLGATIAHRTLARLFERRGVRITGTYQLNTGGNTDFLNMLDRDRLGTKKRSKTEAVQSQLDQRLADGQIHVGPSDYVPFLKDNKVCFLRIEGEGFGGVPMHMEVRLSVEDSPNSAGCVVDAVRAAKVALDRREGGAVEAASAWLMKHPPRQMADEEAERAFGEWGGRGGIVTER